MSGYNTENYNEQGGNKQVINGEIDVTDGKVTGEIQEVSRTLLNTADVANQYIFQASENYEVVAVREVHGTAEATNSPNLNVERLQDTESFGNGDALLTDNSNAGFDLTSTADTPVEGTLVTDGTQELTAGDRLAINISGTTSEIANVNVQIELKRI